MKLVTTEQGDYVGLTPHPEVPEREYGREGQHKRTRHRVLLVLALVVFLAAGVAIGFAVDGRDQSPAKSSVPPAAVQDTDLAFTQTLREGAGWKPLVSDAALVDMGQAVCKFLDQGASVGLAKRFVSVNWGHPEVSASSLDFLAGAAIRTYCPGYTSLID